jgi:hypothetical protein
LKLKKHEFQAKSPVQKATIKCIALIFLIVLTIFIGIVSASAHKSYNGKNIGPIKTSIRLMAGSDSEKNPLNYPAATVNVASTHSCATVVFSIFPSASNTLQPATYYTDLLRIKNFGTTPYTIKRVTISDITGASNLGSLTVYLFATQTDSPTTNTPIGSVTLMSNSSGTINLLNGSYTLPKSAITYIEIVGSAASNAMPDSTVGFTLKIQGETAQPQKCNFVTGSGFLVLKNSAGFLADNDGSKAIFSFDVKEYNGKVKGELDLVIRHTDSMGKVHVCHIKSNAIYSLTVNQHTSKTPGTATFVARATIQDVTNHNCHISHNVIVHVSLTDYNNKKTDTIAVTVWTTAGQLCFSSNWHRERTIEQGLGGGNLSVH